MPHTYHCAQIKRINPKLTDDECLIIHNYMNDMSYAMQRMNSEKFSLIMFRGIMEEHFTEYSYGCSTIIDSKPPHEGKDALLISMNNIEFNVFLEEEIKIIVFRESDPYRHIFEIAVTNYAV